MWFSILHRRRSGSPAPSDASHGPLWSTCLRDVVFHDAPCEPAPAAGEVLTDADAYAFLLETICGLHSPIVGETQVLGQFRSFLASLSPAEASWLGGIGRQLLTDARTVRERHLRGLGARAYGSAVRRYVEDVERVALIGAGALAGEVQPYLAEDRAVDQWTRRELAVAAGRAPVPGRAAIVVAAPVRAAEVDAVARCYPGLARIVDLRSADERDGLSGADVVTLDDVFAALEASTAAAAGRVQAARRDIRRMAAAFERRQLLRPFGWDDLCA